MTLASVNRIAFIDTRGQLCTIAPDGSDRRELTDTNRFFQFPAWSPDSQHIAAIGGDRRSAGVVVGTDWHGAAQAMYHGEDGPPIYLYWTPTNEISFIAAEGYQFGLHISRTDGDRRIRAHGQPFFWRFSPAGSIFLEHANGFGQRGDLRVVETDGMERGRKIAVPGRFQTPDISADSTLFAFALTNEAGKSQVAIASVGGEVVHQRDHEGVVAFSWSPQEPLLAWIHPSEVSSSWYGPLHLFDVASGKTRLLVEDQVLAFFWSPDGSAIAFFTLGPPPGPRQREIGVYSAMESQQPPTSRPTPQITLSVGMYDLASGTSKRLARFEPQPLFVNQFLPFFDQYQHSHRIWAPDSSAIVLPVMARSITPQLAIIPRDGSRARILGDGAMPFWSTI